MGLLGPVVVGDNEAQWRVRGGQGPGGVGASGSTGGQDGEFIGIDRHFARRRFPRSAGKALQAYVSALGRIPPEGVAEIARPVELPRTGEERLFDACLVLGDHAAMVRALEAAVAAEPLREDGWVQLMLALYLAGRPSDDLRAYQRLPAVLAEELGLDHGPEVRTLEAAVLAQSASSICLEK